jgi:IPT/TIG domain
MTRLLLPLLLLGACGLGAGLEPLGKDTSGDEAGLQVDGLDPNWGPPDGGTTVRVLGQGFDAGTSVSFGSASVSVTVVSTDELLVTAPAAWVEATVTVTVSGVAGQDTTTYTYSETEPPDPQDSGDDGGSGDGGSGDGGSGDGGSGDGGAAPTGLSGGLIELSHLQIACPDCFSLTNDIQVSATAGLHTPASGSWLGWLPAHGSCVVDPVVTTPSTAWTDLGDWIYLTTGAGSLPLQRTQDGSTILYANEDLGTEDFSRSAYYDLSVPDGGTLGAFDLTDAVLTPQGFDSITPEAVLLSDSRDAFAATVSAGRTNSFTWSPTGTDTFVILFDVYEPAGASYAWAGQVVCVDWDNGAMDVPGSTFGGFRDGSLLAIYFFRYQMVEAILPPNGATLEATARMGVLGTGNLTQ